MAAFGKSKFSLVPPPNPFVQIDAYIDQLPPNIPKLEDISIFKPTKYLEPGAYGKAYANETHVMKIIDLEYQIKITRHNSYPELIEKITSSIQSEIVHYYAISEICPNVCKLLGYAYDSAKHKLYIHMENCGTDLFDVYGSDQSPETTRDYIGQIINAIDCLHKHGYVHRDLKTENITVTREGTVQLIDFGMARRDGDVAYPLGTPGYTSPENMRPGQPTFDMLKASDIWSLGVTFMFMLLPNALRKVRPELTNEMMDEIVDKLFVNYKPDEEINKPDEEINKPHKKPNTHLTFVQRIETLFTPKESISIMTMCYKEIINIFGLSATWESFFSDDWTKRASAEQLKAWFDTKTAELAAMSSITLKRTRESQFSPQKILRTKSAGGKSRRKKRGSSATLPINKLKGNPPTADCPISNLHRSTPAKNHSAYKKTRSSRK